MTQTHNGPVPYLATDKLRKLIDAKHQCLVQLRELGTKQHKLIEQNEMNRLLKVLVTKQHVIATLQSVERRLEPFRNEAPEDRTWRTPEDRTRCAAVADECHQLLDEIVALEKANESTMTTRRDEAASQLQTAHTANRARAAYAAHVAHRPAHRPAGSKLADVATEDRQSK